MTVREMIKEAYAGGELKGFVDEGVGSRQLAVIDVIASAFEEPGPYRREATVCLPYGRHDAPDIVLLPKDVLLKRYRPSCQADIERLKRTDSFDEKRMLMNKVVRKLLLVHHELAKGFAPDREYFLNAEVPQPLRNTTAFVKSAVSAICGLPLRGPADEDDMVVRILDIMKASISREVALSRAYDYFIRAHALTSPVSHVAERVKEALTGKNTGPLVIHGKKRFHKAMLEELLTFSEEKGKEIMVIDGDRLDSVTMDDAFGEELKGRWVLVEDMTGDLDPMEEAGLLVLTVFSDQVMILTSREGSLAFEQEDLKELYQFQREFTVEEAC